MFSAISVSLALNCSCAFRNSTREASRLLLISVFKLLFRRLSSFVEMSASFAGSVSATFLISASLKLMLTIGELSPRLKLPEDSGIFCFALAISCRASSRLVTAFWSTKVFLISSVVRREFVVLRRSGGSLEQALSIVASSRMRCFCFMVGSFLFLCDC